MSVSAASPRIDWSGEGPRLVIGAALAAIGLGALSLTAETSVGDTFLAGATALVGSSTAVRATASLRRRAISIELLVALAVAGALAIGEFWEAAAVTLLFSGGAYLEARALGKVRHALAQLLDLAPTAAHVWRDGKLVDIAAADVLVEEIVLVRTGERVPVDGAILEGLASVDEAPITGESLAQDKSTNDPVYAGSIVQSGVLRVQTTAVGADTTLGRIIRRVEEAQESKAPAQRMIEAFACWYTPLMIVLAVGALALTRDLRFALTFLVISCPGALVLATPLAVMAGIGRAARRGILIKGGAYLEAVGKISAVAFDKTGTLTTGTPRLTDLIVVHDPPPLPGAPSWVSDNATLRWAALAESGSTHPLARAILDAAPLVRLPEDTRFAPDSGRGVRAFAGGHVVGVGAPDLIDRQTNRRADPTVGETTARLRREGKMVVLVAVDEEVVGVIGMADTPRPGADEAVRRLKGAGIHRTLILSGDHAAVARQVGRGVGVDEVRADLLPDDKLNAIRQLQADGYVVAMVGDGINDAPALAAADVGVAMGASGTAAAIETADLALMTDDLGRLAEAVDLSRATVRVIRQNIAIAVATVVALVAGVIIGDIQLAGGMLIHELSILVVTLNALRLLR